MGWLEECKPHDRGGVFGRAQGVGRVGVLVFLRTGAVVRVCDRVYGIYQ